MAQEKTEETQEAGVPQLSLNAYYYRPLAEEVNAIPFGLIKRTELLAVRKTDGHHVTIVENSGSWERVLGTVTLDLEEIEMTSVTHHLNEHGYCVLTEDEFTIINGDASAPKTAQTKKRTR